MNSDTLAQLTQVLSMGYMSLKKTNKENKEGKGNKENEIGEPVPPVPTYADPNACETLRCPEETRTITDCEAKHCGFAWARRSREDRRRREEQDAEAREKAG